MSCKCRWGATHLRDDVPDREVVRRERDLDARRFAALELDALEPAEDLGRLAGAVGELQVQLRDLGPDKAALVRDVERDQDPRRVEPVARGGQPRGQPASRDGSSRSAARAHHSATELPTSPTDALPLVAGAVDSFHVRR